MTALFRGSWLRVATSAALLCALVACGSARRSAPLVGPFIPKNAAQARGERVFFEFCHQCHPGGDAGLGPAMNDKALPDFAVRTQVRMGAGAMPSFSDKEIGDKELDDLVEYTSALRAHGAKN
jgi:mono/diheme cytochrome c family protein